jgi:hypothetical protein
LKGVFTLCLGSHVYVIITPRGRGRWLSGLLYIRLSRRQCRCMYYGKGAGLSKRGLSDCNSPFGSFNDEGTVHTAASPMATIPSLCSSAAFCVSHFAVSKAATQVFRYPSIKGIPLKQACRMTDEIHTKTIHPTRHSQNYQILTSVPDPSHQYDLQGWQLSVGHTHVHFQSP